MLRTGGWGRRTQNEAGMSFSFSKIKLAVHGSIPVLNELSDWAIE